MSLQKLANRGRKRRARQAIAVEQEAASLPPAQPGPQQQFLETEADIAIFGGSAGGGKAGRCPDRAHPSYNESMETKVLTPKGFKLFGDIEVGDAVCNPDGTVARVIQVHEMGQKQFYRVTLADGSSVECSEGHLWGVSFAGKRVRSKKASPFVPSGLRREDEWNLRYFQRSKVITTIELKEICDRENKKASEGKRGNYPQIPLTAPVNMTFPKGKGVRLPSYTLGVLIGDGCMSQKHGTVDISNPDIEIFREVLAELKAYDSLTVERREAEDRCPIIAIRSATSDHSGSVQEMLRRDRLMGCLSNSKFIPKRIKFGPEKERVAFIQGLFDTDGYMDNRGHVEYVSVSRQLAEDVQSVLRSLGYQATLTEKVGAYKDGQGERVECQTAYRLYVQGVKKENLFRLPRKRSRALPYNGGEVWPSNRVVSVEKTVVDNARCIAVSNPNHLYITDDYIVTHNTAAILLDFGREELTNNPEYGGVIFRRTFPMIRNEGGLWDEASKWYPAVGAEQKESTLEHVFPKGGTVRFAHLQHEKDKFNWQGAQLTRLGWDELTHFTESQFFYLLSRARSTSGIKPVIRATCNPDADSWVADFIDWWIDKDGYAIPERSGVLRWFVRVGGELKWGDRKEELEERYPAIPPKSLTFIPSKLSDNKILMEADPSYLANLMALPLVERERLLGGNWKIRAEAGKVLDRGWFEIVDAAPAGGRPVRFWDFAATQKQVSGNDPDYTAGCGMKELNGIYYIFDMKRDQMNPAASERLMKTTASQDGRECPLRWEQEGGASGKRYSYTLTTDFAGYNAKGIRPQGDKVSRAQALAVQAEAGNVKLVRGPWNEAFLKECHAFPDGEHDDQVDAATGAFNFLTVPMIETKQKRYRWGR